QAGDRGGAIGKLLAECKPDKLEVDAHCRSPSAARAAGLTADRGYLGMDRQGPSRRRPAGPSIIAPGMAPGKMRVAENPPNQEQFDGNGDERDPDARPNRDRGYLGPDHDVPQ